jgi:Fe-S-cluster containining protein
LHFLDTGDIVGIVVTDLTEVYRLGTANASDNVAFRRYLSAHHADDRTFQILASEVQQHIDCTKCANCCRHSVVSLDRHDIDHIAVHLGITPDSVTRLYTDPDPDAPALRILRNTGNACVFLDRNECLIYEARPKTCRDFPHVSVDVHSLGSRASSHDRWAALCPIIFNALEAYKQLTGYLSHSHSHSPQTR